MSLQLYVVLVGAIDGRVLLEQTTFLYEASCDNEHRLRDRVTITSVIPASGMEFDPRPSLAEGTTHHFSAFFTAAATSPLHGEPLMGFPAKVVSVAFEGGGPVSGPGRVRFTLERIPPKADE